MMSSRNDYDEDDDEDEDGGEEFLTSQSSSPVITKLIRGGKDQSGISKKEIGGSGNDRELSKSKSKSRPQLHSLEDEANWMINANNKRLEVVGEGGSI